MTRGFTKVEIVTLGGTMALVVAIVLVLMPEPQVTVEIKEITVQAPPTPEVTVEIAEVKVPPVNVEIKEIKVVQPPKAAQPTPPPANPVDFAAHKHSCMNHVRNLVGLLEFGQRYPRYRGPNLILYLVKKGEIRAKHLSLLFCPGDKDESLKLAGGFDAYKDLDLSKVGEYGHLTSYAGRDQLDKTCMAKKGSPKTFVLLCDDSDHHQGRGFVVGLNGGAAKWRDKVGDWKLPKNQHVVVGAKSAVPELQCLRTD